MIAYLNIAALIALSFTFALFFYASLREREYRALIISLLILLGNATLWLLFIMIDIAWLRIINIATLVLGTLFLATSTIKYHPARVQRNLENATLFDERDHMFSRNHLQFEEKLASQYYQDHPDKKQIDKKIHEKPELGEESHTYYHPYYSHFFTAAGNYLHRTIPISKIKTDKPKGAIDSETVAKRLVELCRFFGAVDVGITPLKPYHLYSHLGRWPEIFGKEIKNFHKTAIVIVVAMDQNLMKKAPTLPAILESTRQYVEGAKIANIAAEYLRNFGFAGRAHTDGNYETLCVPLAVDSGLGELGRIGIFMHHTYGPCVRLAVVTTDLELPATPVRQYHIEEFCQICKKCADNCPTQSISTGLEPSSRGFRHWSIDMESCFSFWKNIGTDCGFCIAVCPYTKPNTIMHKLVRLYISRNPINQRFALFFDDLFYGRKKRILSKNENSILPKR